MTTEGFVENEEKPNNRISGYVGLAGLKKFEDGVLGRSDESGEAVASGGDPTKSKTENTRHQTHCLRQKAFSDILIFSSIIWAETTKQIYSSDFCDVGDPRLHVESHPNVTKTSDNLSS